MSERDIAARMDAEKPAIDWFGATAELLIGLGQISYYTIASPASVQGSVVAALPESAAIFFGMRRHESHT